MHERQEVEKRRETAFEEERMVNVIPTHDEGFEDFCRDGRGEGRGRQRKMEMRRTGRSEIDIK